VHARGFAVLDVFLFLAFVARGLKTFEIALRKDCGFC
jgi:hypothetical protein